MQKVDEAYLINCVDNEIMKQKFQMELRAIKRF